MTFKKEFLLFFLAAALKTMTLGVLFLTADCSLNELAKFADVQSYLKIAESYPLPYSMEGMESNVRHYPLFPFLVWVMSPFFAGNFVYAGFFTAISISALCSVVLYLIARQFTKKAFLISLVFAVMPDKWAQVSVYPLSESVFVLFLLLAAYFHLKDHFWGTYLSLGTLLLARPLGVIFLFSFLLTDVLIEKKFFVLKYAVVTLVPFFVFHGYLFLLFQKFMFFAHYGKSGGWGGAVFSYPLSGLVEGIKDQGFLLVRKIYTLVTFGFYSVLFALAVYHFFKTERYRFFSILIIPYFIFTLFLKGNSHNWWMLTLPRFLIPIAPFGLIFLLGQLKEKYLYVILGIGTAWAIAYAAGSHVIHLIHGRIV
ncbi:MAG TPA: hypothetical protein PKL99_02595 [Syntrophales bacterium]|nr:hypothetical protein [Syntrophales bacterium]